MTFEGLHSPQANLEQLNVTIAALACEAYGDGGGFLLVFR
jgi:hypothetical protein